MTLLLNYPDTVTFYKVSTLSGYRGTKTSIAAEDVPCIFVQNTGFEQTNFQEGVDSDAICYPDFENDFVVENANRLEGMYILAPLFDGTDLESWYKIVSVTVNRDHLLGNESDNIELRLKKTSPVVGGVS